MLDGNMSAGADTQPGTWLTVGVLIGLALALLVGVLVAGWRRSRHSRQPLVTHETTAPSEPLWGAFSIDDLPGFAERPPGWMAGPAPTATPNHQRTPPPPEPGVPVSNPADGAAIRSGWHGR